MLASIIVVLSLLGIAQDVRGENSLADFSPDQKAVEDILKELVATLETRDEPTFDVNEDNDMTEVRRIITDHGLNPDTLLSDFSFLTSLSAVSGIFKSGDARRWTTLNFAYQLACYQGRGGSLLSKSLWAYNTYNGYGCYCGGGHYSGNYLDAVDYCCKIHDYCYDRVIAKYSLAQGCQTYTTPYSVSCCKDQRITKCTDKGPSAGRELCECDQAMSSCVAKHNNVYNKAYFNNRAKCTGGNKPLSMWQVLKTCKNIFRPRVTLPLTYGSQGSCPAQKKSSWWWGKKKDQEK